MRGGGSDGTTARSRNPPAGRDAGKELRAATEVAPGASIAGPAMAGMTARAAFGGVVAGPAMGGATAGPAIAGAGVATGPAAP